MGSLWLALSSCSDLDEYRADGVARVFTGTVIGSPDESFIRRGFPAGTELRLTFDPSLVGSPSPPPGTLTTSDDCSGMPTFSATPLQPIAPLAHDPLSQYDFPGGGRVRNYVFAARPSTGCLAGRDAMIFLSLMDEGTIELRVIVGSGDEAAGDRFGVFRLRGVAAAP